jgi:dTDP-4-amino-4,6-dideoxygalactose transaminase
MLKPFKNPIYVTRPLIPDIRKFIGYLSVAVNAKTFSNNAQFVVSLEEKLKRLLEVKNGALFCNGTIALMIAIKSLDLKGSVLTTAFTFPATANVLVWNNIEPIFCDIDYETMNITPETSAVALNKTTSAILAVHVFGTPCDIYGFKTLADIYDLKIIYDAAHAFMVKYNNIGIGNFGDITMFSFHPTKLFHTAEGGMLAYNNNELDIIIKQLRAFGIKNDDIGSIRPGINGKMNELQAIMGLCILDKINEERTKRKEISNLYKKYLSEISWITILNLDNSIEQSYQYFPIRIKDKSRDEINEIFKKYNVFPRKYFYPLCSDFAHFKYLKADLPNSKKVSEEILCLPYYGDLSKDDVEKICSILLEV